MMRMWEPDLRTNPFEETKNITKEDVTAHRRRGWEVRTKVTVACMTITRGAGGGLRPGQWALARSLHASLEP
jgi:hypothetical protein